jgi:tetratricopeptide (TPR) repeat protein
MERYPAERRHLAGFLVSRDPDAALTLARADLAERQDAGAYDTLAWALYHLGRYDEADEAMAEVVAIGTDTASVNYHAGAIAAAVGDDERAIAHLRAALDINPTFGLGDADDARSLLHDLDEGSTTN